jgi:hypothetical protein
LEYLASHGHHVLGVEIVQQAVDEYVAESPQLHLGLESGGGLVSYGTGVEPFMTCFLSDSLIVTEPCQDSVWC